MSATGFARVFGGIKQRKILFPGKQLPNYEKGSKVRLKDNFKLIFLIIKN